MKKMKKGWKIVLIAVGVFAVVEIAALGWFGIGPLRFIHDMKMNSLPGNKAEYSFDQIIPLENSPLAGKKIAVLGSSVVFGAASQQDAVAEYLSARFGCDYTKEAVSGTTLVDNGANSYVQRLQTRLDPNAQYDLFVCQLSTNDASKKLPLGEIAEGTELNGFDTSTVTGAIEYIIVYARETWNCPVVFFTGSRYDSEEYSAMVTRLHELEGKYGIGVLDLWTSDSFNAISDTERALYMNDNIHPTRAGYRDWWGPELEKQLIDYLKILK